MNLSSRELHDLNDLTLSCVNTITCMSIFLKQVGDPELKQLIHSHMPAHIKDYNTKVDLLKAKGEKTILEVPEISHILQSSSDTTAPIQPVTPRTTLNQFNDREIATSYLLTLKRAGREYAWSAMEATNPTIRIFLEDAFRMCSRHAYDIWQWMYKKGYYATKEAPENIELTISSSYNEVKEENLSLL
ncbi:spore coat protein [Clostridium manihotivorum]|uniref:Spore coat protein n=1 Tax=Clostridium manihotivorum TaxID=2320868 RepID=A0A3R5V9R6_9CLOT|nr:spore coat protein [Clostridium manihotivorum]QAA33362.1 spore coat protein [Clostridium manihotivorum]